MRTQALATLALLALLAACGGAQPTPQPPQEPQKGTDIALSGWPAGAQGYVKATDDDSGGNVVTVLEVNVGANGRLSYALPVPPLEVQTPLPASNCQTVTPAEARFSGVSFAARHDKQADTREGRLKISNYTALSKIGDADAQVWYADRDAQWGGSCTKEGVTLTYNAALKRGWNFVVFTATTPPGSADPQYAVTASATLSADFKWAFIPPPPPE